MARAKTKKLALYVHKPAMSATKVTSGSKTGYLRSIKVKNAKVEPGAGELEVDVTEDNLDEESIENTPE
ncbi:hypothetical protein H0H92_001627, partial [Tricholoma furcatifolium]